MMKADNILTVMAGSRGRWLWSETLEVIELANATILQAQEWMRKYDYFLCHPQDEILKWQFNAEGRNLAGQVHGFLGPQARVMYVPVYPELGNKRGEPYSVDYHRWFGPEESSPVIVNKPLSAIEFIMEACEQSGAIAVIEEGHYREMIDMSEEDMHALIRMVVAANISCILEPDRWPNDEALVDFLGDMLLSLLLGVLYFDADGSGMVFCKPTVQPTREEKELLSTRAIEARSFIPHILKEMLMEQGI